MDAEEMFAEALDRLETLAEGRERMSRECAGLRNKIRELEVEKSLLQEKIIGTQPETKYQWQPINTSPTDGTVVLVATPGGLQVGYCDDNSGYPFGSTHWCPIPEFEK